MQTSPVLTQFGSFEVNTTVDLRLAQQADLPNLEWYGQYAHYRELYARTFADQQQGKRLMLLAMVNAYPIGQIFVHLNDAGLPEPLRQRQGYVYALRVMEPFRGRQIGTRLILKAEQLLQDHGYKWVVIAVAKDNHGARQLYERLGYVVFKDDPGRWSFVDHEGQVQHVTEPSWMLKKRLRAVVPHG